MKKSVALSTNEETETAMNEWESNDSYTLSNCIYACILLHVC